MIYPKVSELGRAGTARRADPRRAAQRVALVTGSSRGLGCAIARRLARDGLAVAVNDVGDADRALDVVGAIRRDGGVADAFMGDVTDRPPPGRTAYATAKSAQIGLTRSWARELAALGITVNTVAPGFSPGRREDVAHAVSFVASAAASFITGQRIVVDGGRGLVA